MDKDELNKRCAEHVGWIWDSKWKAWTSDRGMEFAMFDSCYNQAMLMVKKCLDEGYYVRIDHERDGIHVLIRPFRYYEERDTTVVDRGHEYTHYDFSPKIISEACLKTLESKSE